MPTLQKIKFSLDAGIFLTVLEGIQRHFYLDVANYATIGIGHLLTQSERMSGKITIAGRSIEWRLGLTDLQCLQLLSQDVAKREKAVRDLVTTPINQHQFDALVVFVFNIGRGAFRRSTLLRLLNQGHYDAVPDQMRRWVYADGKVVEGLRVRREATIKLWSGQFDTEQ